MKRVILASLKPAGYIDPSVVGYSLKEQDTGRSADGMVYNTLEEAEKNAARYCNWRKKNIDIYFIENSEETYQESIEFDAENYQPSEIELKQNQVKEYLDKNPDYHVDTLFGDVLSNDSRYVAVFNELKNLGYRPRQSYSTSRMYTWDTITIDVPLGTRDVPQDVLQSIQSQPNLVIWDTTARTTAAGSRKLKFSMRDSEVRNLLK